MAEVFQPIRGLEENIAKITNHDGYIYFAYDTGNIYLDKGNDRFLMGSSSTGLFWSNGSSTDIIKTSEDENDTTYTISISALENDLLPKKDSLILNADGRFFRTKLVDKSNGQIYADLIAISGTGGGGGTPVSVRDINLTWDERTIKEGSVYVAGQQIFAIFTPSSDVDSVCSLTFTYENLTNGTSDTKVVTGLPSGQKYRFDTSWLPVSDNLTLHVTVKSANSEYKNGSGWTRNFNNIKIVEMKIQKDLSQRPYTPIIRPNEVNREQRFDYKIFADPSISVTQHVYIDDVEVRSLRDTIDSRYYTGISSYTVTVPDPGVHKNCKIRINVSTKINDIDIYATPIEYEAAWARQGNDEAIIWVGGYDSTVINYETSYIKFMVYDPQKDQPGQENIAQVILYKENVEVGQMEVRYSSQDWAQWDISDIYTIGENNFSIACRGAKVDIQLNVTTQGARQLDLEAQTLLMRNYSASGRSNSEVQSQRIKWTDKKANVDAILTGFNWKNNGWNNDGKDAKTGIDNGSYLTVANGAHVTFPFNTQISMNYSDNYTFEFRFRIRNIQKYSTLVKTYAKYYVNVGTDESPEKSKNSYTQQQIIDNNYKYFYDEYGSPLMDENVVKEYEKEEGIVIKWMEGDNGICIGTQEAYFASPREVVSVRYKEDEVINISFVISRTDGLAYIYLNGIASGAAALPITGAGGVGAFGVTSNFEINSDYCDIDLYRMRVYQTGLSMPQIIHNYLSDIHSIKLYDQNQLTSQPTKLSYDLLVKYNNDHPDEVTMPYAVWKIISDNTKSGDNGETWSEILPYYKGNKCVCECTFVNTPLDKALENGEIDEWYYYTHSPSYRAVGVDIDVQGTSSQSYPRRNYKTKFKAAAPSDEHPDYGWFYTKGSLAGKRIDKDQVVFQTKNSQGQNLATPIEKTIKKKWHMDNENIGTNKFTWKIDYMESSGTYNTGYANLMGNTQHPLYTKHPLDFYNINGLSTSGLRTTVYGFPVLVFHEYENTLMNISEAGAKYEYIGRYNLNLDKSSNEYYGFELEKEQPFIDYEWDEMGERDVIDPDTGEPQKDGDGNTITEQYVKAHHSHPWISQIAECWELEDNQGTWCSFKYPNADARQTGFRTLQTGYNDRIECMLHYEYRYSYYGDQLDAIGADGHYDGTAKDRAKYANEIGTTHLEMSNYAYERYKNLEALFNWLDSTDQDAATNANLTTPLTIQTPHAYAGQGESSEPVYGYAKADIFDSQQTYYLLDNGEYVITNDFAKDENDHVIGFKDGKTYYISTILYYNTTFNKDSAGYRLEKFRREFDQHLNKEYCLVYFIMTELLLCYDSRGKNMMLATFGPQKSGGDYIWFPIFYDIDTQLGLNNSGAYLWDYDADVTADGLFSTPTSVLWVNLWAAFPEEIMSQYRVLRGLNDGTNVVGSLSYENISGAYTCDPTVFDSYAMKGVRPIIAIGLDEYYKYFATTAASGVGWFTQTGQHQKDATADYAYACQGDKILTTELLIRNRLNYIDSWWQGGDYHINKVKGSQLQCRVSGNRKSLTSDTFLEIDPPPEGFTYAQYPKDYFDAQPGFKLKPFLKQYISFFTDEVAGEVIKYTGEDGQEDGLRTPVPAATITAYKQTPETPNEQLNYIPGVDYLSSLGDLSTSYISEFTINRGKRLLDITLGSDIPGYKNEMIKSNTIFNLHCGKDDDGKKPLLQKMVLTGLTNLDKTIDISGSAKLQEFRALNTNIPNVYFAEGAPIHTIHLPSSIRSISISQDRELKNILTSRPVVCTLNTDGKAVYADPLTYRGLYVEGLTDATIEGTDHAVSSLSINGGGMGYSSYDLLKKLVLVKTGTQSRVNIGLIDVQWTPYTQVEYGESYDINKASIYKVLNSHGTYDDYVYDANTWNSNTLNGTIYTFDENAPINTIQDLSLLDKFITEYNNNKELGIPSQFQQLELTGEASLPTITGNLYVANSEDNKIPEANLTEVYEKYFPNLKITAAYVNTSYLISYLRIQDNGKIETLDTKRTNNADTKILPTCLTPTKTYYDFIGWSTQNPNEVDDPVIVLPWDNEANQYVETEVWNEVEYDASSKILVLYAIFAPHKYIITYKYADDTIIEKIEAPYSAEVGTIRVPNKIPQLDESSLPLEQTYAFLGYSDTIDGDIVDLSKRYANRDMTLYAIFEQMSVYEVDYHDIFTSSIGSYTDEEDTSFNVQNGVFLSLISESTKQISGKIVVPAVWDNKPVIGISEFRNQSNITHIFFEKDHPLRIINSNCCKQMNQLKYFDFISLKYLRRIEDSAFQAVQNLILVDSLGDDSSQLVSIKTLGMSNAFASVLEERNEDGEIIKILGRRDESLNVIHIPSSIKNMGSKAFASQELTNRTVNLEIGSLNNPSLLSLENNAVKDEIIGANVNHAWKNINFYSAIYDGNVMIGEGEELINYLGLLRDNGSAIPETFTIYHNGTIYEVITNSTENP